MAPGGMREFLADQYAKLSYVPVDLAGKVVIVTGSNVGIGYGTVQHFIKMNPARVIMACRNLEKAATALDSLKEGTKDKNFDGVVVEAWELDLSSFESCQAFAKRFQDSGLPLHILVNNAGLGGIIPFALSKDGFENMFATNHLGTALLTLLLLPALRKTAASGADVYPRILNLASEVHLWTDFKVKNKPSIIEAFNDPKFIVGFDRYATSKFMNVLFTKSLARHLQESEVVEDKKITTYAINPGMVTSDLGMKENTLVEKLVLRPLIKILSCVISRTPEEGSKTTILAAISPDYGVESGIENGLYFSSCKPAPTNPLINGEEGNKLAERLWIETLNVLPSPVKNIL